eukprot:PLAT290.1.p1 GENE.PLAT290.1~~PLAT290.1.p1  ORF type:complete len:722 (-),score=387.59 PLAT290.1:83-2248(-)
MATVNVQVAVRCRPLNKKEIEMSCADIVRIDGDSVILAPTDGSAERPFTFDHAYAMDTTQDTVYGHLGKPLVEKAMEGFNGTIFAYGQTGSGKTHSMMGSGDDVGIIPLMNRDLFSQVAAVKASDPSVQFLVTVSYLEIYNEVLNDLLNPSDKHLKIREHPELGIYVEGLAELIVESELDVLNLIEQGNKVRRVAETMMNARSSRSHSCFTIKLQRKSTEVVAGTEKETLLKAKINLVDLAGSERASKTGATGDRLREGAAINKSLSSLGNVINALAEGRGKHIPYRDSKLTRLLQESLGGNALTVMIAAISPADRNMDETLGTLQYANRAKNIKNETRRNEDVNERIIRELREEIAALRDMLSRARGSGEGGGGGGAGDSSGGVTAEKMAEMEELIASLEHAKQSTWEEKQRMSEMYEAEREKNLHDETKIRSVMQTVKEEHFAIMRRIKDLQKQRKHQTAEFKKAREKYTRMKASLDNSMKKYSALEEAAEDGAVTEEMVALLNKVEAKRKRIMQERDAITARKAKIKKLEEELTREQAELSAQRLLLEEDEELRTAIREEEREKMASERTAFLEGAMAEERERLSELLSTEKHRMMVRFRRTAEATSEREQAMELELLDVRAEKNLAVLELEEWKGRHTRVVDDVRRGYEKRMAAMERKHAKMMKELVQCMVEDGDAMRKKYTETAVLLQQARADVVFLMRQKEELEAKLAAALADDS